jgi:hypothetical protein
MSHGVHAVQHEVEHEIKYGDGHGHGDGHGGHGGLMSLLDNLNKKVALLIGVVALLVAFSEPLGKSAQTAAITGQLILSLIAERVLDLAESC